MIEVSIGTSADVEIWKYLLRLNVRRHEKLPTVLEERVWQRGKIEKERARGEHDDAFPVFQTFLEQAEISQQFRPVCEFLASCRYLHVVPQIIRDPERQRRFASDPYGGDLLRRMTETPEKKRGPRLRRIAEALSIAVPQFSDLELEIDEDGVPHLQARYAHWRPGGSKHSETEFSDGTLRLIGLLWSVAEGGGPLLLEEPELSLNDAIVGELPGFFRHMQRLSGRQVVATTHSTAFLDGPGLALSEIHRIVPGAKGSSVITSSDDQTVAAQVELGWSVGQAIMPLLRPRSIEKLHGVDVAA